MPRKVKYSKLNVMELSNKREIIFNDDSFVEYLFKNSTYIFPAKTKIYLNNKHLIVEINDKKTRHIAKYLAHHPDNKNLIGLPITNRGAQLAKEYQAITDFFNKYEKLDYLTFEFATNRELALCTFFKSTDMIQDNDLIQAIKKELPFLLNIFWHPLIHLKEADIILPVDAVKRINKNTIKHLSHHAENWESIMSNNVIPTKLLTEIYEDDYSIYENIVFRDLINKIMFFLRKKIYYLTIILDTFKESIHLDALNRLNHQMYYLAIGKLYIGFFEMGNSTEIADILENMKFLYRRLNKQKNRAVYAKNASVKPLNSQIKRTNILTMHKDYKHVYYLYQKMNKKSGYVLEEGDYSLQCQSQKSYELFCMMLMLFAASNFNMRCISKNNIYENNQINAEFNYKNWHLIISSQHQGLLNINTIIIDMHCKEKNIKFLLIPMSYHFGKDKKKHYEHIVKRLFETNQIYDKYIFLESFDFEDDELYNYSLKLSTAANSLFYAVLPISISEINSFRRLQKLLFESMIKSDDEHDICAFCGEKLIKDASNKYLCIKCRTAIKSVSCQHCQNEFIASFIDIKKNKSDKKDENQYLKDLSSFLQQEKQYSFRNIVNIKSSNFICPFCENEIGTENNQGEKIYV